MRSPLLFDFFHCGSFPASILILCFFPHRKLAWPPSNNVFVETQILLRFTIEVISVETVFTCTCSFAEPDNVFEILHQYYSSSHVVLNLGKVHDFVTTLLINATGSIQQTKTPKKKLHSATEKLWKSERTTLSELRERAFQKSLQKVHENVSKVLTLHFTVSSQNT